MAQNVSLQRPMSNYKTGNRRGNPVNDAAVQNTAVSSHNKFNTSYAFAQTARYGDIGCFFAMNAVARDLIPLKSNFRIESLPMKSQKMTPVYMHRSYYEVKMNAILPRTFEYIFKNPVHGDDVPDDAYCIWDRNLGDLLFQSAFSLVLNGADSVVVAVQQFLQCMFLMESLYSHGGLFASLGCPLSGYFQSVKGDFDDFYDAVLRMLLTHMDVESGPTNLIFTVPALGWTVEGPDAVASAKYAVNVSTVDSPVDYPSDVRFVSLNRMIEILKSYPISAVQRGSLMLNINEDSIFQDLINLFEEWSITAGWPIKGVDVSRFAAYQLTCAEWYTNDKVDYVYNADLWRKTMDYYMRETLGEIRFFDYNDISIMYDALSAHNYSAAYDSVVLGRDSFSAFLDFLCNLFLFNRSLKFEDYFTGARTRPLAVGDVQIQDSSDPLEVVRSIQMTRFLNAVNRSGVDEDYLKDIYATLPLPSDLIPKWIISYDDDIVSSETTNTADDQGKITSRINGYSGDHSGTVVRIDGYPSIVLGLYHFDMPLLYVQAIDRDFFIRDRYDMFNPYYQYDGDQSIDQVELYPVVDGQGDFSFAYTGRDNHRKMRIPRAMGGFCKYLPSWAFLFDGKESSIPFTELNPEFILSSATEFDRFFTGFPSLSLAGYFHFAIKFINTCESLRPMEYAPAILNG